MNCRYHRVPATRIQNMSNLRLDVNMVPRSKVTGDYLALCGNVGNPFLKDYQRFMRKTCKKYKDVFLVPGKYDYYYASMPATKMQLKYIASEIPNLHIMDNTVVELDDQYTQIAGTTLWCNVSDMDSYGMDEFVHIKINENDYLTPARYRMLYNESTKFVNDTIQNANVQGKRVIMLSSYAPQNKNFWSSENMLCWISGNDADTNFVF